MLKIISILSLLTSLPFMSAYAQCENVQFGSRGDGPGQFSQLWGVAVDDNGNVYVADQNNNRIEKFDNNGQFLSEFGTAGSSPGQFLTPTSITIESNNTIYVTDTINGRVQKFDMSGNYIAQFGSKGSGNGQFMQPISLSLDRSGNLYVADFGYQVGNFRIAKWDGQGKYIRHFGSHGDADGQFDIGPSALVVNQELEQIYVVDEQHARVQRFDLNGEYLGQFGSGELNKGIIGIAIDANQTIYVSDPNAERIQKFDQNGVHLEEIALEAPRGGFVFPAGIAVDKNGSIFVADKENYRILKICPKR